MLPTRAGPAPFSITPENVGPSVFYPNGGLSGIMLNGNDSTAAMTGGRIGADLQLRDTLMPTAQASIDELAFTVANRFAAQGLSLFTDGSGQVPTGGGTPPQSGYIGFASTMQVNPAVTQNPSLVRDGTNAITGTATGASAFTPNPPGGPAGFNSLIARVVNYTFSGSISNTATQPAPLASGLGPEGNLNLGGYASPGLNDLTASVLVNLATQSNTVSSDYTTTSGLESSLSQKLNNISGVSIDTEMASMLALQNAYAAGGKVMNTLESMFNQLLQAVQ
jgi:flagellar hook-associated protein 1 FlgK